MQPVNLVPPHWAYCAASHEGVLTVVVVGVTEVDVDDKVECSTAVIVVTVIFFEVLVRAADDTDEPPTVGHTSGPGQV